MCNVSQQGQEARYENDRQGVREHEIEQKNDSFETRHEENEEDEKKKKKRKLKGREYLKEKLETQ